jgi:hypothetical protein
MRKQKSDAFTVLRVLQSVFEMMEPLTIGCGIKVNNEVHADIQDDFSAIICYERLNIHEKK